MFLSSRCGKIFQAQGFSPLQLGFKPFYPKPIGHGPCSRLGQERPTLPSRACPPRTAAHSCTQPHTAAHSRSALGGCVALLGLCRPSDSTASRLTSDKNQAK